MQAPIYRTRGIMRAKKPGNDRLRRIITGSLLLIIAALAVFCAGCTGDGGETANTPANTLAETPVHPPESEVTYTGTNVEKIELLHFYGSKSCSSCTLLGYLAEETVNAAYAPELASGELVFSHVNFDLPENGEIVERYGPTGSSLWIGVYDENGFYAQELIAPWYMTGDRPLFRAYLGAVIDQQLP